MFLLHIQQRVREMTQSSADIRYLSERGSILIGLIVTMVVMAVLGGGMLYLTTTSSFNELYYGSHSDAYYSAEAGGRYAKAVIRDAYANDKTKMNAINASQTFTLANGSRFQITSVVESVSGNTATVTFSSTGMVGSGLLTARRQINYSIQPANQTAGGSGQTTSEPNMDNFVASPQGQFTKVDGALKVTGVTQDAYADEKRAFAYYKNSSVDFSSVRTAQNGYLSYDAQVKVKSTTDYFLAGLGFRTHPLRNQTSGTTSTDPRSLHISFLRFSDNDNTDSTSSIDKIPLELKYQNWTSYGSGGVSGPLEIGSYYIILWMDYGAGGDLDSTVAMERLLAYKKIDSTSGVFSQTYSMNDNMESDAWSRSASSVWSWVTSDFCSSTHSYYGQASAPQTLQLTFWHKLDVRSSSDYATVQICSGSCSSWTDLVSYNTDITGWTQATINIPSQYINATNVKIRFQMQNSSTSGTRTWYIDDVSIQNTFSDNMESGDGKWTYDTDWSLVTTDYHSSSHSFRLSASRNTTRSLTSTTFTTSVSTDGNVLVSPAFNIPNVASASLTFMHRLDIKNSSYDFAGVDICQGACSTWTSMGNFTTDTSGWAGATLSIPSSFLNQSNVKIRFRISTTSTTQFPTWYIDDVKIGGPPTFTAWSTLLVRLEEKLLTASDFINGNFTVGTRVNKIVVYYSTLNSNGTGNHPGGAIDVNRTGNNPLGTFNWPAASGASDMNFTLVKWDWVRDDSNTTYNSTVIGNYDVKTIVETKYYRTTGKDSDNFGGYTVTAEYDDLGLSIFGVYTTNNVFFDDFAVKIGTGSGSDGSGTVIQYP